MISKFYTNSCQEQLIGTMVNIGKWSVISNKNIQLNVSYSWFNHIWSKILLLLLSLRVGLLIRGMKELEWQLLIKPFYMAVGCRRLILRSATINRWSDWEVDNKISFNFIANYGIFDFSGGLYTPIIITVHLFESEIFTTSIS